MDLALWYKPNCPYCHKVIHHAKQLGISLPMVDISNDPKAQQKLKKTGGKVQVPCLIHEGKVVYESQVIMEWITTHKEELTPSSETKP